MKDGKKRLALSDTDLRILDGKEPTKGDELKESKYLQNTLKKTLQMEIEAESEDGTIKKLPIGKAIVIKKIGYDLENPDKINLKEYSAVLGEDKELNVNVKGAEELFGDIAIKDESDAK